MQRWLSQVKSQELGQACTGGSSLGSLSQVRLLGCSRSPYGQPHLAKCTRILGLKSNARYVPATASYQLKYYLHIKHFTIHSLIWFNLILFYLFPAPTPTPHIFCALSPTQFLVNWEAPSPQRPTVKQNILYLSPRYSIGATIGPMLTYFLYHGRGKLCGNGYYRVKKFRIHTTT